MADDDSFSIRIKNTVRDVLDPPSALLASAIMLPSRRPPSPEPLPPSPPPPPGLEVDPHAVTISNAQIGALMARRHATRPLDIAIEMPRDASVGYQEICHTVELWFSLATDLFKRRRVRAVAPHDRGIRDQSVVAAECARDCASCNDPDEIRCQSCCDENHSRVLACSGEL